MKWNKIPLWIDRCQKDLKKNIIYHPIWVYGWRTCAHTRVCLCAFVRPSFVSGCAPRRPVFDFKAQQMKPKTGGKLTKHADPRWLMGRAEMTSWPASQTTPLWCAVSACRPDPPPHLLDITCRNSSCLCNMCYRWVVPAVNRPRHVAEWHLSASLHVPAVDNGPKWWEATNVAGLMTA